METQVPKINFIEVALELHPLNATSILNDDIIKEDRCVTMNKIIAKLVLG